MLKYKDYSWPVRWGLRLRKALRKFAKYGGGKFRLKLVIFIITLLDLDHQEAYENTIHKLYKENG